MRKSTMGVLVGLLAVGCGDPSDEPRDDAPESEQAERGSGFYSVTFAVKANPASLGSASVSIFNALGETCAGTSCKAYPLNQAYFQATPKSSARFVGWSGCSFVGLGHYSAATFLENVGVLDETCTANFADASGTTSDTPEPSDFPTFPDPDFPDEPETDEPEDEGGGTVLDETDKQETAPGKTTPGKTTPGKTPGEKTPGKTTPGKTTPSEETPPVTEDGVRPGDAEQEADSDEAEPLFPPASEEEVGPTTPELPWNTSAR